MSKFVGDFSKPSLEIIHDLINHSNDTHFKFGDLLITAPEAQEFNKVQIDVTARQTNIVGTVALYYNRIDLQDIKAMDGLSEAFITWGATYRTVVELFGARFGITLRSEDVLVNGVDIDSEHGFKPGDFFNMEITAKEDSFVWTGSCLVQVIVEGEPYGDRPTGTLVRANERMNVFKSDRKVRIAVID